MGVFCVWWMSSPLYLGVYVSEGRDGKTKRGPSQCHNNCFHH